MNIIGGRICKPERLLYYIIPTEEEKKDFYKGIIPDKLMAYLGAYGTYDIPGLMILNDGNERREVLGIEFRPDDSSINYPDDLECVRLNVSYMVSSIFPNVGKLDDYMVLNVINDMKTKVMDPTFYSGTIKNKSILDLIEIFTLGGRNRVVISVESTSKFKDYGNFEPQTDKEAELYHSTFFDPITEHYNWNYIWPLIAEYPSIGIQDFAFVHFDVKDFKAVNVVYGHEAANSVLEKVARHMKKQDWIYQSARCDNDNFAMMIKDMPQEEMKQKLLTFFNEISRLDADYNKRIYYRCGVVPMRNTVLLGDRVADAGKQVQRQGTKLYETEVLFYTDSMFDSLDWSSRIRSYLDTAIENDEFLVYLQPKYDIHTEKIYGAEALIRWMYRGRELLAPYRFIPIMETGGLISKLDDIVLNKVCMNIKQWESEGFPIFPISVNLSRKSIGNPNLADHLTQIVDYYGVKHSYIDFELTETSAYDNQEHLIDVIKELKSNGFKISMDDFGTGFSSLSLLGVMPLDTIKIDKSFVDGISPSNTNPKEYKILKHIISMVNDLNLTCLAEGAEEKEQVDILREFGCEVVQGYYYSKPIPVDEYKELIIKENS